VLADNAAAAAAASAQSGGGDFRNLVDNFDIRNPKTDSIPDTGQFADFTRSQQTD